MPHIVKRPLLIDEVATNVINLKKFGGDNVIQIRGQFYIHTDKPYYSWKKLLWRLYHAYCVLVGSAIAVQYAKDHYPKEYKQEHILKIELCSNCKGAPAIAENPDVLCKHCNDI